MTKLLIISAFVMAILFAFATAFAYSSLNSTKSIQNNQSSPQTHTPTTVESTTPLPNPTLSPTPTPTLCTPTLSPTPTDTQSSDPLLYGSFGPLGGFGITSPTNQVYTTNNLKLTISGQTIVGTNVHLSMSYSVDGQNQIPFNIEQKPINDWDPFIGAITGSVALPPLSSGSHSITVYGNLNANGPHLAQVNVYFIVQ